MPSRRAPDGAPEGNPHHRADEEGTVTCGQCDAEVEDDGGCDCELCGECNEYRNVDDFCGACDECTGCCACAVCNNCDSRYGDNETCGNCEYCPDCCECVACERCRWTYGRDLICTRCRRCRDTEEWCCSCTSCTECNDLYDSTEVCPDCDRCFACRCTCEETHVPTTADGTPIAQPAPTEVGTDAFGNQGALPFDAAGGAVEGCACRDCNADRTRHRTLTAAGLAPPALAEPEPDTRGYRCGIHFRKRHIKFWAGEATTTVPHTRFAAVEIEVARATNSATVNEACETWAHTVIQDGSLSCSTGYELTTSPAAGAALHQMVLQTCSALKAAGAVVDQDCGLHVHADTRDLDHRALWRFVRIYQKVEPALYSVVTTTRFANTYCAPCGWAWQKRLGKVAPDDPDWLARSLSGMTSKYGYTQKQIDDWKASAKRNKNNARQYDGLNIGSHLFRGTVECRIHHGTTDPDKILPWMVLWAGLVQRAKDMTDEQVEELPGGPVEPKAMDRWDKQAWKALEKLAPTAAVRSWMRTRRRQFADLAKATSKTPKPSTNGEI